MQLFKYDPEADALYITKRELKEGEHVYETREEAVGRYTELRDYDENGGLIGVEVLNASKRFPIYCGKKILEETNKAYAKVDKEDAEIQVWDNTLLDGLES